MLGERDILGTQLIRRKYEAELLYEKIKINHSYLNKGEAQYKERLNDIKNKKEGIADMMLQIKKIVAKVALISHFSMKR